MTTLLVGSLAALLATLLITRATRRIRQSGRGFRTHAKRFTSHSAGSDEAALLDAIARQVRSGSSLTSAFIEETQASSPLADIIGRLNAGCSLGDALATVETHDADLAFTVQALAASAHLGGPVAATLDEAAAVLRERAAAGDERRAHGSQARLSARVLTIVPVAFAVWSALASQRTRDVYVTTLAGSMCAACGLALNLIGWRWMKLIMSPARS
ncbi:MAG: type II secretion system F family protein [Ilumatobacteraceae bacterium]